MFCACIRIQEVAPLLLLLLPGFFCFLFSFFSSFIRVHADRRSENECWQVAQAIPSWRRQSFSFRLRKSFSFEKIHFQIVWGKKKWFYLRVFSTTHFLRSLFGRFSRRNRFKVFFIVSQWGKVFCFSLTEIFIFIRYVDDLSSSVWTAVIGLYIY